MMTESNDDPPERLPLEVSHPHLGEFFDFLPELNKESDRGRVLISCSYLDELMRRTLLAFVIDRDSSLRLVEGFNAPLGTFSTRTAAAYALGLISERKFNECETLRRIRNRFAHDVHASFDMRDIRDLCKNLTKAAPSYGDVMVDARGQYTTAAVALILQLTNRPVYVSRKRRQPEDWPGRACLVSRIYEGAWPGRSVIGFPRITLCAIVEVSPLALVMG